MTGILIILAVVWVVAGVGRRRRWARMGGPPWMGSQWGAYGGATISPEELKRLREDHENQQAVIEGLESKIAQMEERLDFTERLLMNKREGAGSASEGPRLSASGNPEPPVR
jgi:hypothetical protein